MVSGLVYFISLLSIKGEINTHWSFANSIDPGQSPRLAASDLRLHCLPLSFK